MTVPDPKQHDKSDGVLAYRYVADPAFALGLAGLDWERDEDLGGLVLTGSCPVCQHPDAIDAFVPTLIAGFKPGATVSGEYVECRCGEDHKQPAGGVGCGRWGQVSPRVAGKA